MTLFLHMYICRFCITYVGFESCISETLQAMVASDNIIIHTNSYNAGKHLTQKKQYTKVQLDVHRACE